MDASVAPRQRAETAGAMELYQGGAVDASSIPARRAESDPGAASISNTGQGNGEPPPAILSGRLAPELSSWGRLPPTVRDLTWGHGQRLGDEPVVNQLRVDKGAADALLAPAYEWLTTPGSILNRSSWTTEDAVALMTGGPAVEKR